MPLIVTAAQILAAIGTEEDPLAAFAADYKELRRQGLFNRQIADRLGVTEHKVQHDIRRAREAGLLAARTPRGEKRAKPRPAADARTFIQQWRQQVAS